MPRVKNPSPKQHQGQIAGKIQILLVDQPKDTYPEVLEQVHRQKDPKTSNKRVISDCN